MAGMKKSMAEQLEEARTSVYCVTCGEKLVKLPKNTNVFKSDSPRYNRYGHLPYCKSCVYDMFEKLIDHYKDRKLATFHWCQILDYPVTKKGLKENSKTNKKFIDDYYTLIYLEAPTVREKGFLGGDFISEIDVAPSFKEKYANSLKSEKELLSDADEQVIDYLFVKWGRNVKYEPEDYEDLETFYQEQMEQRGGLADKLTERTIINAAKVNLMLQKSIAREDSDDTKKLSDALDKVMSSGELRVTDINNKKVADILTQDIVQVCEAKEFIDPWKKIIQYPHQMDIVDQIILVSLNHARKTMSEVFSVNIPPFKELPEEYKVVDHLGELSEEPTQLDERLEQALSEIKEFKEGGYDYETPDIDEADEEEIVSSIKEIEDDSELKF